MSDVELADALETMASDFDEAEARQLARFAFSKTFRSQRSPAADMQTKHAKGEMKLKPAVEATLIHATATRRAQFSQVPMDETDMERCRIARVIYDLSDPYPMFIAWKHHSDPAARKMAREAIANRAASWVVCEQRITDPIQARQVFGAINKLTHEMVKPGGVARPNELDMFLMPYSEWRNSGARKQWESIGRYVRETELAALRLMMEGV